jgi:hypothetical protein
MDADVVNCSSMQVGESITFPISSAEFWPSIDPQAIFSQQNWGISNFVGMHNQVGLYNGIGLWNQLGTYSGIGLGLHVGGHVDAQPSYDSAAVTTDYASPDGDLWGDWDYNGTPLDYLHNHSDVRLKENIKTLDSSLDKVLNLRGVSFTWNKQLSPYVGRGKDVDIGLIAQEVEEIIPEIVQETSIPNLDFQIKNVDYDRLVPVLVEAMKEQQKQIEDLKETVSKLSTPSEKVQGVCYDT